MKSIIPALALATAAALPAAAQAQFMDMLKSTVTNAAVKTAVNKATDKPQAREPANPVAASTAASKAIKPGCPQTRATPLPPLGERPGDYVPEILWPEDTGCDYYKFADLKFDAARAAKKAFVDASKVPCQDCEGGYGYDSQAHFVLVKGGDYSNKFTQMLIALQPGQALSWKGQKFNGEVKATGAHPLGDYPCRQFHWTLRDSKKAVVAEREGLYCEVKGDYASTASWTEVL